ncbi:FAD binding domain-containing protein [Rhodococcus sp. IEGM 1381]|uniref:FAD binding domain-containing protein n=1 Tax=Rhodococcus sp. IEGM 1381 TaxID=3047085 RepID=UPI0024B762E3|nr:FAD binding domain-containing protein [Rhodococcus sp. IEGM 1381]MDI9897233.1 FAD binding domain-containing protein [Rhodococcus sp. IEGM 1381]
MDLGTVDNVLLPSSRADLPPGREDTAVLAGGTWLFSEKQDHLTTLVDITALGWEPLTVTETGLEIAATCTIETLARFESPWPATALFPRCAAALLASFKIWKTATVGGNIALALPAGAMISATAALDGIGQVWSADGREHDYDIAIDDLITGPNTNALRPGDVLRSIEIPRYALEARTAMRKLALSPLGRSAAVVIGRVDAGGEFVLTVSASTVRPFVLRFPALPTANELDDALAETIGPEHWFDDPHGAPDWRRHISCTAAQQIREELS